MRFALLAAAALAIALPVTAAESPAKVTMTMANFSYAPAALHLHAGQSVTIHFVNEGSGGHDFTAEEFFAAATMDAANRAHVGGAKGRVSLGKGDSTHSALGMTGRIVVD